MMQQNLIKTPAKLWSTIGRAVGAVALLCNVSFAPTARAETSCTPTFGESQGSPMALPGPSQVGVSALPISIVAGNFSGQCTGPTCDIAVAEQAGLTPDHLLITRGNPDGTFNQPGAQLEIGTSPVAIATGTFRPSTGRDDIAIVFQDEPSGPGKMMIMSMRPDGSYAPKVFAPGQTSLTAGLSPKSLATGLFASGRPFVAVGNYRSAGSASTAPTISVFVEDSSLNFTTEELPVPAESDHPLSQSIFLAAADISGQSVPGDIAVGYKESNLLLVLHRNENVPSHFDDPHKFALATGFKTRAIAVLKRHSGGDDLVVLAVDANDNTNIVIIENQNGELTPMAPVPILNAKAIAAVAVDPLDPSDQSYMLAVAHAGQNNGIKILRLTRNAQGHFNKPTVGENPPVDDEPLSVTFARDGMSVAASLANNKLAFFRLYDGTFMNTNPTQMLISVDEQGTMDGQGTMNFPTAGVFHPPSPDDDGLQDLVYVSGPDYDVVGHGDAFLRVLHWPST
jgi:hypothetical protein